MGEASSRALLIKDCVRYVNFRHARSLAMISVDISFVVID